MTKTPTYILKASALIIALAIESFIIMTMLYDYVKTQDYFSFNIMNFAWIGIMFLLILCTYSLTVGGWGKWEQYILVPLPISAGIFLVTQQIDLIYAGLISVAAFAILSYDIVYAVYLEKQMIKFKPNIILSFSSRGILFVFSLVTAVLVFLHSSLGGKEFNVGRQIGIFADENYSQEVPDLGLNLSQIVEFEFDRLTAPYKDFISPLVALLVFTIIRFVGSIAGFAFMAICQPLFWLFKKVGFLHVNHESVEKEDIGFESAKV